MWALPLAEFLHDPSGGFLMLGEAFMPVDTFTDREISNDGCQSEVDVSTPDSILVPVTRFDVFMVKENGEWRWWLGEGA